MKYKTILVVVTIVFGFGSLQAALFDNLVAHWSLDDSADDTFVPDLTGYDRHGTATENTSVLSAEGIQNTCFDFAGVNAIVVDDTLSFGNGVNDFDVSITAWVYYVDDGTDQRIIAKWGGKGKEWAFYVNNDRLVMGLYDNDTGGSVNRATNDTLNAGWNHVAMTYDGSGPGSTSDRITLYVDGEAVAGSTVTTNGTYESMVHSTEKVVIGAQNSENPAYYWKGKLDTVMVFSKILTPGEVSALSSPWPIADAGPDQTLQTFTGTVEVTLDGSGSYDNNGSTTGEWTMDTGNEIVTSDNASGTYTYQAGFLNATYTGNATEDGFGTTNSYTLYLSDATLNGDTMAGNYNTQFGNKAGWVSNDSGLFSAQSPSSPLLPFDRIWEGDLDSSLYPGGEISNWQFDRDEIASWKWTDDLGDAIPDIEKPSAFLSVGIHTITLTVTDNDGLVDTDTVTIEVIYSPVYNTLSTSSTSGGTVIVPGEGDFYYEVGDVNDVNIVADPESGYEFVEWTISPTYSGGGSFDPNIADTKINVDVDYVLQAVFQLQPTLTITSGDGGSVITPGEGVYSYNTGTTLDFDIKAENDVGYRFDGWTGTADVEDPTDPNTKVSDVIDSDLTLHANFKRLRTLTVSSTGFGSVTTPYEPNSPFTYDEGQTVDIIATPATGGYYFMYWTGEDANILTDVLDSVISITMDDDYELIANFSTTEDSNSPYISSAEPQEDKTEVAVNSMITITIADFGTGVDPNSVEICLYDPNDPNYIVYAGDTESYDSALGNCQRTGTKAAYTYYFAPNPDLQPGQTILVNVYAEDQRSVPNVLDTAYSFDTAGPAFGPNIKVSSVDDTDANNVDTATYLGDGTIMAVWQQLDSTGNNDIYYAELHSGKESFDPNTNLTGDPEHNQINPVIAADVTNTYIVWEQNEPNEPNEPSEIFVYTSANGWGTPVKITDPNNDTNQTNPAMAIDSTGKIYVTWLDEYTAIKVSTSTDAAATWGNPIEIVDDISSPQTRPAIAIDANDIAYIVWANDGDIYGATSGDNWASPMHVIDDANALPNPVIAAEDTGTRLHILWDDGSEVFHYANDDGLSGPNTITDITDADEAQTNPTIAAAGTKAFAAWKDEYNGNPDIYYAETTSSSFGTNVLVNDDTGAGAQFAPVINTSIIDDVNVPYIAWVDGRSSNDSIYYAGARTFVPLVAPKTVMKNTMATVDVGDNGVIDGPDDILLTIPADALPIDTTFTISKVINPPPAPAGGFGLCYEFAPSGIYFTAPVTITIPFTEDDWKNYETYKVYWYDAENKEWTEISDAEADPDNMTIAFNTTHFTIFAVGGEGDGDGDDETNVGHHHSSGCSVSPYGEGSVLEFLLPYALIAIAVTALKLKNKRKKNA